MSSFQVNIFLTIQINKAKEGYFNTTACYFFKYGFSLSYEQDCSMKWIIIKI